jgi:hypothetical protein
MSEISLFLVYISVLRVGIGPCLVFYQATIFLLLFAYAMFTLSPGTLYSYSSFSLSYRSSPNTLIRHTEDNPRRWYMTTDISKHF